MLQHRLAKLSMRTAAAVALQHASHDLAASTADSALSKAEDAKAEAVKALIKTQAAARPRMDGRILTPRRVLVSTFGTDRWRLARYSASRQTG